MVLNFVSWANDRLRLVYKLTPSRFGNLMLSIAASRLSALIRRPINLGFPFSINFETAAICNLRCPECVAGTGQTIRSQKIMDLSTVEKKLIIHRNNAFYCNLYFQGEPFLNPHIFEIIKRVKSAEMYTVISTNGHFLNTETAQNLIASGLDRLIVSLDGIDESAYNQYRTGGNFNQVTEGIRILSRMKKKERKKYPLVVVQMLVHKGNEHQLARAGTYAKQLGADVFEPKSMQVYTRAGAEKFLPASGRYNRYGTNLKSDNSNTGGNACFRLWSHIVYTSDGLLVPCCYDKKPDYPITGEENSRSDLWHSAQMKDFRTKVLQHKITLCSNCKP